MLRINSLIDYATAAENLERKSSILQKQQQKVEEKPKWLATVYRLITFENRNLLSLSRECQNLLDAVERVPTIFSSDLIKIQDQKDCFAACTKAAKLAISILSSSNSPKVKTELHNLTQRVIALQYRIEAVNGGLDHSTIDPVLTMQLCEAALHWKQKHSLIVKKEITLEEIKKMEEASTYPEFARLILSSRKLEDFFFNWALQNNNGVSQLVEFPATCARLKSVYLASRVGKLLGTLQIQKNEKNENVSEKVITLPFYTRNQTEYINILDESKIVELNDGINGTKNYAINEIFNVFSKKNREVGNLEMFKDGIRYWNCHKLSSVDLTLKEWWKQLPVVEEITKEEMEKRIDDQLAPNDWVVFLKSSRTAADMDLDGRHGYVELGIPQHNGTYSVYPFGIFPESFPNSIMELVLFLAKTNTARISYPDENFFYSHRQQASHPIRLTADEAKKFIKTLQKELIRSRYGHLIFQFGAENCAYWAQTVVKPIDSTNFFKLDYVKSFPQNPLLKNIFKFFRNIPVLCRNTAIKIIDRCFGSGRGVFVLENRERIFKSHHTSSVRNEFVIYQPGYLHQQIAEGKIKGYIHLGNC